MLVHSCVFCHVKTHSPLTLQGAPNEAERLRVVRTQKSAPKQALPDARAPASAAQRAQPSERLLVMRTVTELQEKNVVPSWKRPNPKQRKKLKLQSMSKDVPF